MNEIRRLEDLSEQRYFCCWTEEALNAAASSMPAEVSCLRRLLKAARTTLNEYRIVLESAGPGPRRGSIRVRNFGSSATLGIATSDGSRPHPQWCLRARWKAWSQDPRAIPW
jgi:hypothetical protein